MRTLIFLTALLAFPWICHAADPYHLELYNDNQETRGVRLTGPLTEIRTAERQDKNNLGILFSTGRFSKVIPVDLKFGNLSTSGSLSKMNSPELSNGTSPFSSGISSITGVTASLPGYTSFSRPESMFCQFKLNPPLKKTVNLLFNIWSSPENEGPVVSTMISEKFFSNQLILSTSCTTGSFYYKENCTNSWFLNSPYYRADAHSCSQFQFSAEYKNRKTGTGGYAAFTTNVYESPFGPYTAVYRTDLKLTLKRFEFYNSSFLNAYEDTFTSSGKKLSPCFETKTGILYKKPLITGRKSPLFIKSGINSCAKINLTQAEHPLRVNTGIQISNDITALTFSVSADSKMISRTPEEAPQKIQNTGISCKIKNSWYLKYITPSLTITRSEDLKTTEEIAGPIKYKISAGLSNNGTHKISANCAYAFTVKSEEVTDKKISSSISCRFNFRTITVIGKVSAVTDQSM